MKKKSDWVHRDRRKGGKPFNTLLTSPPLNDRNPGRCYYGHRHRIKPDQILGYSEQAGLDRKVNVIIQEASFIGIVNDQTRPHFKKLARHSSVGYDIVKEILRLQKVALVARYDRLLANGGLVKLEATEYSLLYRAKYLDNPKSLPGKGY